jgi:hypothetical protein
VHIIDKNQSKQKIIIIITFFKYQSTPEKKIHFFQSPIKPQKKKKHKFLQLPGENEWQKKEGLENQRFLTYDKICKTIQTLTSTSTI